MALARNPVIFVIACAKVALRQKQPRARKPTAVLTSKTPITKTDIA